MAITLKQPKKERTGDLRQKIYFLAIFIVAVILIIFVFRNLAKQPPLPEETIAPPGAGIPSFTDPGFIELLKKELEFLETPAVENLKLPVELPIEATTSGKTNPFQP